MPSLPTAVGRCVGTVRIRSLERGDLGTMLHIFSEAIPRAQLARSIYLAPGAEAFLTHLLEQPGLNAHEQLWGVELDDNGLVAVAHSRRAGEYHHLNSYAVLPAFQRRGLGARMMAHWESLARSQRLHRLSLDVALENEGARRHYARFGFMERYRINEYRLEGHLDLPDPLGVQREDWPLAQASFQAYGFGRFALVLGPERYPVDLRVGDFRLGSSDARLLAALQAIDPVRAILVRTSKPLENPAWVHTGTIAHMTKELDDKSTSQG